MTMMHSFLLLFGKRGSEICTGSTCSGNETATGSTCSGNDADTDSMWLGQSIDSFGGNHFSIQQ